MYTVIKRSPVHGRGVFTIVPFGKGSIIETNHVLPVDRIVSSACVLCDYVYPSPNEWQSLIALGHLPLLNNGSARANTYVMYDEYRQELSLIAARDITKGEELLLDYDNVYGV